MRASRVNLDDVTIIPRDAPEAAWFDYVYIRDNPCGPHDELWLHSAGCQRWFKVRRDTRTHDILASARLDEALPAVPQ